MGRWSPDEAGVISQYQLILFALLSLSQEDGVASLLLGSLWDWEQLNEGDPRGKEVEAWGLLWPEVEAQHPCRKPNNQLFIPQRLFAFHWST